MRIVFVHGACVRDGAWWWEPTARLLAEAGVPSVAARLPSCGEGDVPAGGPAGPGLEDDAASLRRLLADTEEPTVVVAHSYGGMVAAETVGDAAAVRHLVLISSYLPDVGQRLGDFSGDAPAPFLDVDPDAGTLAVRPELLAATFLHDCDERAQAEAAAHLAAQSLRIVGDPVGAAGWRTVPTTYVLCADDRGTPAERQRRFAERADAVVEVATGHHPFIARPEVMAAVLDDLA